MNKKLIQNLIRFVSICCAVLLFIAVLPNPINYYWMLRGVVTFGAGLVIVNHITKAYWVVLFGIVLVLFNPIFPIHFYMKLPWIPIDIITGLLFLTEIIVNRPKKQKSAPVKEEIKTYGRDRIL